jgi:PAS domain S-box-containing protein
MANEAEQRTGLDDGVLRAVVQASPDGLVIADADGRIVYVNAAMCEITGFGRDDLIGRSVDDLVPDSARETHGDHRAQFARAPRTRPMGRGLPLTALRKDGTEVAVEISLSPVESPGGVLTIASVRDITDRLEQSERLRSAAEMLALSTERERIARDLHDTVLQRLFGLGLDLQALGMRSDPAVTERIESAVDEIDRIIREIRTTVFTLGSAQRAGSLGADLADVIAQATRVLGFTPRLRIGGPVESLVTPEARLEMVASLREALGNVARHARATEAVVELTVDDMLELSVRDNGVGLPDGFEASAGNGLKNLVSRAELLGGTCMVANGDGGGVLMRWRVPLPG